MTVLWSFSDKLGDELNTEFVFIESIKVQKSHVLQSAGG
jgi:hypothetical protein